VTLGFAPAFGRTVSGRIVGCERSASRFLDIFDREIDSRGHELAIEEQRGVGLIRRVYHPLRGDKWPILRIATDKTVLSVEAIMNDLILRTDPRVGAQHCSPTEPVLRLRYRLGRQKSWQWRVRWYHVRRSAAREPDGSPTGES